jgi:TolB protein
VFYTRMTKRISFLAVLVALLVPGPAAAARNQVNGPIVFAGGTKSQQSGLWAWGQRGKTLRRLTSDPGDVDPKGSRDGRWIVFTRQGNVFRARSDGSQVQQVTTGGLDRAPSFSPSGQRILFSRTVYQAGLPEDQVAGEHIFSIRVDGTGLHQLTTGGFSDRDPVFSPNGRIIAFDRFQEGHTRHVFTMRADGTNLKDATPRLAAWSSEPAFSPSGNRIAYVRSYPGNSTSDVFTIRPNGTETRRLTGHSGHPLGGVSSPSWSPDGTRIVFQRENRFRGSKLLIIRVRDRKILTTLGGPGFAQAPDMRTPTWLSR